MRSFRRCNSSRASCLQTLPSCWSTTSRARITARSLIAARSRRNWGIVDHLPESTNTPRLTTFVHCRRTPGGR